MMLNQFYPAVVRDLGHNITKEYLLVLNQQTGKRLETASLLLKHGGKTAEELKVEGKLNTS